MLDIDRFKNVNDRHGHPTGDRVINAVVRALLESTRNTDIVCRMGGEEFAVMLPSETIDSASEIAERIRIAVSERTIPLTDKGESFLSVTISIGVAMLEPTDASLFDVLGRADKALYRAKSSGRNRVESESGPYNPSVIEEMNLLRRSRA
jgi:diguanylate cyclase